MQKFCQIGKLKPEKIEEYKRLHAAAWPKVKKMIKKCNLEDYHIYILGDTVVSYFTYTGDDYEGDMAKMDADPVTLEWWTHTKPCFARHSENVYYEDMEEIFFLK